MKALPCPVCKSLKTSHKLTYQKNELYRCLNCTFEFLPKTKTPNIYNQGYFEGQLSGVKGYQDYSALTENITKESLKKLAYINKFTSSKKILDLGSGTGIFLKVALSQGYNVTGNDIAKYAVNQLKKHKIKALLGSIEKNILPKESYDLITGWDVIEHLYNPALALKNIHKSLKPKGYLFLTTPDTDRIDAKLFGINWYGYKKIPEHVSFFNNKSLSKILEDSNFKVIEIKPWGFYRNLGFIAEKLDNNSPFFYLIKKIILMTGLQNLSFFLPLTDSIIVAQKK